MDGNNNNGSVPQSGQPTQPNGMNNTASSQQPVNSAYPNAQQQNAYSAPQPGVNPYSQQTNAQPVYQAQPQQPVANYVPQQQPVYTQQPVYQQPPVVQQPVVTHTTEVVAAKSGMTSQQMDKIIFLILSLIETLLILRIVFRLLRANPSNSIISGIYSVTTPLMAPFAGIFNTSSLDSVVEIPLILAMVMYALLALGLSKLFKAILR